jgi:predicted MPP superfamily phosphohydrolase
MRTIITLFLFIGTLLTYSYAKESEWRFAVVGDTHVPNAFTVQKIIPKLIEDKVEVVLFPGDIIQGGKGQNPKGMIEELDQWKELISPLEKAGVKILVIRGNHEADVRGNNTRPWYRLISQNLNLVESYKNVTFVGLDNYINGEHSIDIQWFENALKNIPKKNIIVPFGHEPAFSCNTFHPVSLDANIDSRNKLWDLLEKYGVSFYFCGHSHQYNLSSITHDGKTIHQVVSGGGGGFLQPKRGGIINADGYQVKLIDFKSETGYLLVTVSGNKLSTLWQSVYDEAVRHMPEQRKPHRAQR